MVPSETAGPTPAHAPNARKRNEVLEDTMHRITTARGRAATLVVPLAAVLAAACTPRVEAPGSGPPVLAGEVVPPVQYDAGSRAFIMAMAPVDLPAGAHHHAVRQAEALTAEIPVGGWMTGYDVDVIDRMGNPVPREVIHHVNIMAPDRRELFSPIMQRVGAVGHETAPVRLPRVLGYPIRAGDRFIVIAELHNPTDAAYDGVRVLVRFSHLPEGSRPRPIAVQPFYMDVTPPAELHSFDLPPGRSIHSWEATAPISGRILGMGGHLHDHALELRLDDLTTGRTVWRTAPIFDDAGRVVGMPQSRLWWRFGLPVRAGHTYRLTAVYDNATGQTLVEGGMGALGGIIVPSRGTVWPDVDPADPEYVRDVALRITDRDAPPDPARAAEAGPAHHHRH
jgi:hypothetical protein